jgi:hypothetical protein
MIWSPGVERIGPFVLVGAVAADVAIAVRSIPLALAVVALGGIGTMVALLRATPGMALR